MITSAIVQISIVLVIGARLLTNFKSGCYTLVNMDTSRRADHMTKIYYTTI